MLKKFKNLNLINNLVSGIGIVTLGLIVTIGSTYMYTKVINLIVFIFIIYTLSKFINFILKKKIVRNKQVILELIIDFMLVLVMIIFPNLSLGILPVIFSLYLFFNSIVKFINYLVLKELNLNSRFKSLFFSIAFFLFAIPFLFYPLRRLDLFVLIIGVYCIILGINRIYEFILDVITDKYKLKIKRRLRISLPLFFEAFIPKGVLNSINKYIDYITSEEKENETNPDILIFIHLSKYGFNQFGHMDIMFDGKIYSYGNYDKNSRKLFTTIGDGVLFVVDDKDKYINFCMENSKKTIVEYGIKLTEKEKQKLKREFDKILVDTYLFKLNKDYKTDYARKLYKSTKAKFYKFKKGEFKTYFVLGVNCTYFADKLLRCVFEVLKLVGIISPGTYYEYLEENYKKKNSKVVSKKIYSLDV